MKRIVHVVDDLSPANTGITSAVRELSRAGLAAGWSIEVVSVGAAADWGIRGLALGAAPIRGAGPVATWRHAPGFDALLGRAVGDGALIHIHGLWFYPQWRAAHLALQRGWPLVLSPHNMLGGWLWRRGQLRRLKKALYFNAVVKSPFSKVRAIHALSDDESGRIAQFLPRPKRTTIPNALDLDAMDRELAAAGPSVADTEKYVLFLGRIHPVKGLEALVDAAARVPGLRVVIAGPPEDAAYDEMLKARAASLGIADRVTFSGPVHGSKKWHLVSGAWVFCSPTHSEGVSMASVEAMAARVPIVTTPGAGFSDLVGAGSLLVERDPASIATALAGALQWTPEERAARGVRARASVEQNYSWARVWPRYENLYELAMAAGKA